MALEKKGRLVISAKADGTVEMRGLSGAIDAIGKSAKNTFTELNQFSEIVRKVGSFAFDTVNKIQTYNLMQKNLAISTKEAEQATGGLIDKFQLVKSAALASSFGVAKNGLEFAKLAKVAAIVSQQLGIDTTQALDDLVRGLSRNSVAILDNLGIVVKLDKALTGAARAAAFKEQALIALEAKIQGATLNTNTLAASYTRLKNRVFDVAVAISNDVGNQVGLNNGLRGFNEVVGQSKRLADAFRASLEKTGSSIDKFQRILASPHVRALLGLAVGFKGVEALSGAFTQGRQELQGAESAFGFGGFDPSLGAGPAPLSSIFDAGATTVQGRGLTGRRGGRRGGGRRAGLDFFGGGAVTAGLGGPLGEAVFGEQGPSPFAGVTESIIMLSDPEIEHRIEQLRNLGIESEEALQKIAGNRQLFDEMTMGITKMSEALENMPLEVVSGGFQQLAAGMFDIIDAAIQGEAAIGRALLGMLKNTLLGIAKEATIKAIFNVAEGIAAQAVTWGIPNPKSVAHFAAAAQYGIVAGVAGAGGLAVSGIQAAVGGGPGGVQGSIDRGADRASRDSRPVFGARGTDSDRPMIVKVFLGNSTDPSAIVHAQRQIEAQITAGA